MSYISGLGLAIPTSAVSSPTQQAARPRAAAPTQANAHLQQVYALRGKQKQLEVLLLKLKKQLAACRASAKAVPPGMRRNALASCAALENAIAACLREIQRCAVKAAEAAKAAVSAGATTAQVNSASSAGTAAGATAPTSAKVTTAPSATPVVESSTASLLPSGQIVPGPGAQVVDTPALSETLPQPVAADSEPTLQPQDVAVSVGTGSIGTVVVIGVVGFLGYRFAKKKGWL